MVGVRATLETIEQEDRLRQELLAALWDGSPDVGLDVIFTRDPVWLQRSTPTGSDSKPIA